MKRWVRAALAGLVLLAPVAWACGPFFPTRMLLERSSSLTAAPRGKFGHEVAAIGVQAPALGSARGNWASSQTEGAYNEQTLAAELSDLTTALGPRPDAAALVKRYAAVRALLTTLTIRPANGASGATPPLAPPAGIPAEFADYLDGAIALARHDPAGARAAWERLLRRPPGERRFRSTWAAYMLARHAGGPDEEVKGYQRTRELAAQGFVDTLGLAAASLGYEARVELERDRYERAARLYLEGNALGDPTSASSLRMLCWRLLKATPAQRSAALRDATVRRVVVAHLVSSDPAEMKADSTEAKLLASMLDEARDERQVDGADRLAWIAYQRGDLKATEAWLDRAKDGSPVAAWVRSKLLARRGKLDEAAGRLSQAIEAFPLAPGAIAAPGPEEWDEAGGLEPTRQLRGELAVLRLARGQFVDALDLLLRAGYWRDAAHVAERVLTADELRAYVDRAWPAPSPPPAADAATLAADPGPRLRYLLARRLGRERRWDEVGAYLPAGMQATLAAYRKAQGSAADPKKGKRERALALWEVAQIERKQGLELIGTELGPDWAVDDGQFDEDNAVGKAAERERLPLVTEAERRRVRRSAPAFLQRFHYRRVAAEHALEASRMLDKDDAEIETMLCGAYGWLSARDPKGASKVAAEARRRGHPCK